MKITRWRVIGFVAGIIGVVILYYGLRFIYYYRKVKRMVGLATSKLSANVHTKYFTLTHKGKVPVIILKDKPKYYMKEYAKHFSEALKLLPMILPHFFVSDKKYEEFKKIAKENVKFIPKFYLKELRYLSRYSGIDFQDLVRIHVFSDYFNYSSSFLCSVFAVDKKKSELKKIIIGRNLDYFVPFIKDLTVIHIFRRGKREYLSMGFLGVLGVYSGMNRDGLVISNLLALNPKDKPSQVGIPSSFLYRKILETKKKVVAATKIIKNTYKPFSNNILISDTDKTYIIQAYGDKIRIRKFRKGYVYITNYILAQDIRDKKHIGTRYRTLDNIAKTNEKINVEDMKKILDSVAMKRLTQHSIIFIPEDKKIYFSYGEIPSTKGPYVELEGVFK